MDTKEVRELILLFKLIDFFADRNPRTANDAPQASTDKAVGQNVEPRADFWKWKKGVRMTISPSISIYRGGRIRTCDSLLPKNSPKRFN